MKLPAPAGMKRAMTKMSRLVQLREVAPVTVVTEWLSEKFRKEFQSNRARGASPLANGRSLSHRIVVRNTVKDRKVRQGCHLD